MNDRHAFHAGNHADVLKHVVLAWMTVIGAVLGYVSQKIAVMLTESAKARA
jgi:23S rRNA A2030 N6-methylase RlmJ